MSASVAARFEPFTTRANARIAGRYDQVPYASQPYPQSHPAKIAMVAKLFGLDPPQVEVSNVLEIGCASGGNVIPLAAQYPDARFTGLDISSVHIDRGRSRVARLGLTNVELLHGDIGDFAPRAPPFDYIICHGVYSWVPGAIREAIRRLIAANLAPDGVAYVSYNVLPGWRQKQALRDALMSRVREVTDARSQIALSRAYLSMLAEWNTPGGVYSASLREWAAHARNIRDDYFAHEFIEDDNEPQTFTQFVEEAARAGLAYLGESDFWMMLGENFEPGARRLIEDGCGDSLALVEQMIDVLTGRTFRQTLLFHDAACGKIVRKLDRRHIEGLHFFGALTLADKGAAPHAWMFVAPNNRSISTSNVGAYRALIALGAASPGSLSLEALLLAAAPGCDGLDEEARGLVVDALFKALVAGVIDARTAPVHAAAVIAERPAIVAHCRIDATAGEDALASLRHEPYELDIVARILAPSLDGTRNRGDLIAALVSSVANGDLRFQRADQTITNGEGIAACAAEHVDRTLRDMCARAMLTQ